MGFVYWERADLKCISGGSLAEGLGLQLINLDIFGIDKRVNSVSISDNHEEIILVHIKFLFMGRESVSSISSWGKMPRFSTHGNIVKG
jgi:hypothetical protein